MSSDIAQSAQPGLRRPTLINKIATDELMCKPTLIKLHNKTREVYSFTSNPFNKIRIGSHASHTSVVVSSASSSSNNSTCMSRASNQGGVTSAEGVATELDKHKYHDAALGALMERVHARGQLSG